MAKDKNCADAGYSFQLQMTKDDATPKVDELAVVGLTNTLRGIYTNLFGFALTNILCGSRQAGTSIIG